MAAAVVKSLVFVYLLLNVCHCSPTTELLQSNSYAPFELLCKILSPS